MYLLIDLFQNKKMNEKTCWIISGIALVIIVGTEAAYR